MTGRCMRNNKGTHNKANHNKANHVISYILFLTLIGLMTGCASTPEVKIEIPVFPQPPDEPRFYFQESIISSADVIREDKDSVFKRMITGQARSGIGMGKPFAVSVHQGRIFVSDTEKRLVAAYDKPQGKYLEIGTSSPGELLKPMGLDTDNQGTLYVCDANLKQVVVYDRDGKYLRTLGNSGSGFMGGHRVPVVGRVSMDLITLDVTGVPEHLARPGGRVQLIGPDLPVDDVAAAAGTIGYEILTSLGARYHRVYVGGDPKQP